MSKFGIWKRFHCSNCGYTFQKKLPGVIHRCLKCEYPCIEMRLKEGLTDEEAIRKLDYYSQKKWFLLRYPRAWVEDIANRKIENKKDGNKKVRMKDGSKQFEVMEW